MQYFFAFVLLLCCGFANAQDSTEGKALYIKEFNWHITVPKGFDTVSSVYMAKMETKGRKMIEDATDREIEGKNKHLFTYRNKLVNYLIAEYIDFDPKKDGNYIPSCKEAYSVLYETLQHQFPGKNIDSAHTVEMIDGLKFQRFSVKIQIGETNQMSFYLFNHLFGKKDLTVSIVYISLLEGALILDSMRKSRFGVK